MRADDGRAQGHVTYEQFFGVRGVALALCLTQKLDDILGESASNAQRLLLYFRRDAQGRLLMGGRGHFGERNHPGDYEHLTHSVRLLFPDIGELRYEYRWAGRVAITRDFLPHVHEPAPGVTMALGYNGRGIATATAMGKHLARRITGQGDFPFPITPIRPIPLHGLQRFYIAAGVAWYSLLDRTLRNR